MDSKSGVFLDTSIQIARFVHCHEIKKTIESRLQVYAITLTSLVVRAEFKRRFLKEAKYLLTILNKKKTLKAVMRHVSDVLPPQQVRKQRICLQTLMSFWENESEEDQADRLRCHLTALLSGGLDEFDAMVGHVIKSSNCACGNIPIRTKANGDIDLGTEKCEALKSDCGIRAFLSEKHGEIKALSSHLDTTEVAKSGEIERSIDFLKRSQVNPECENPCLTVGDLIIALESSRIPSVYTMNGKESQHFCRALNQTMVLLRSNPEKGEDVFESTTPAWPPI